MFKNGQFHGFGRLTYPTGEYYEGFFEGGKKHGKGKRVTKEGEVINGNWDYQTYENRYGCQYEESIIN